MPDNNILQNVLSALNQHLLYCPISPSSGNEGVELELASLLITLSDLLAKLLFPIPTTLGCAGLKVLVP